jgi:hypothetical protein
MMRLDLSRFRQLAPPRQMVASDLGQAVRLGRFLMDPVGGLPHLLGQLADLPQNAGERKASVWGQA